jgi:hypothetical protein
MQALTLEFQAALLEKDVCFLVCLVDQCVSNIYLCALHQIQMKKLHLDNARAQSVEQASIDLLTAELSELELAQSSIRAQLQQLATSPDQPRPATPMSSDSNEVCVINLWIRFVVHFEHGFRAAGGRVARRRSR